MTSEELKLLKELKSKLQQAELALSDHNEFINGLPLDVANREACLINTCMVGEALSDAKELLGNLESIDVIVTEQTTALLATIGGGGQVAKVTKIEDLYSLEIAMRNEMNELFDNGRIKHLPTIQGKKMNAVMARYMTHLLEHMDNVVLKETARPGYSGAPYHRMWPVDLWPSDIPNRPDPD